MYQFACSSIPRSSVQAEQDSIKYIWGKRIYKQTNHGSRRKLNVQEIQIQRALKLSNEGNQMKETC